MSGPRTTLAVKAVPNAPRTEIVGWVGDALKVKLKAPPVEGRANEELCRFIANHLGLPRRAVTLLRGDTARQKLVGVEGLSQPALHARLGALAGSR